MDGARAIWSSGDYPRVAQRLEPIAVDLVSALGRLGGLRLLDVAAGTGNVALAAARLGATVTATDITPRMVELGRARTDAAGLVVTWRQADLTALPFDDATFDVLTSCLGVMFAPDHEAAVVELARMLRPGARLGLVSWSPDRDSARLTEPIRRRQPPPRDDAGDPTDWGRPAMLAQWLAPAFTEMATVERPFTWDFASTTAALDYFFTVSPLHVAALESLTPPERLAVRDELAAALAEVAPAGPLSPHSPYILTTATRRTH